MAGARLAFSDCRRCGLRRLVGVLPLVRPGAACLLLLGRLGRGWGRRGRRALLVRGRTRRPLPQHVLALQLMRLLRCAGARRRAAPLAGVRRRLWCTRACDLDHKRGAVQLHCAEHMVKDCTGRPGLH